MATTSSLPYYPTEEYLATHLVKPEDVRETAQVPPGFPKALEAPLAWNRAEIEGKLPECIVNLGEDDIIALESALSAFEAQGFDISSISTENFVLPESLSRKLRHISDQCYHGLGFAVVHGLESSKYTPEQNVILYAGITAYVAPQRGFLDRKHKKVLCHVVNAAKLTPALAKSPGFTDGPLAFHTDNCEILSLYALDIATEGGKTLVSSAYHVFNDLAGTRPDVLHTLADHWVLDTFKDHTQFPPVSRPLLHTVGDKVVFTYSRFPMSGSKGKLRSPALPPPTEAQIEAMNVVQQIAAANSVALPMGKGDIAFINDMAIMHARSSFKENGAQLQRHLLKFHLRDPAQDWPVPPALESHWKKVYGPNTDTGERIEEWCMRYYEGQEEEWPANG